MPDTPPDPPEAPQGPQARGPSAGTAPEADGPRIPGEKKALLRTRLVWAAALLIQGLNLAYELSLRVGPPVGWPLRPALFGLGVLLVCVVFAHSARLQAYKRGWRGRAVTPEAFFKGNLLSLAALTLGACLLLGAAPSTGADRGIVRMLGLAATLATALNWPTGRPMRPAGP